MTGGSCTGHPEMGKAAGASVYAGQAGEVHQPVAQQTGST